MTDNMMPELTLEPTAAAEAVPQLTLEPTAPEVPEPEEEKSELQRIFTDTIPSQNPDLRDWNKRKTKDEK